MQCIFEEKHRHVSWRGKSVGCLVQTGLRAADQPAVFVTPSGSRKTFQRRQTLPTEKDLTALCTVRSERASEAGEGVHSVGRSGGVLEHLPLEGTQQDMSSWPPQSLRLSCESCKLATHREHRGCLTANRRFRECPSCHGEKSSAGAPTLGSAHGRNEVSLTGLQGSERRFAPDRKDSAQLLTRPLRFCL
ncbi:uncharacterized protein [Desmodus rotundus]|uniref:uncharacterized protein isoform X2 n=1 Tax=Desmodus rotundus TaxID=9430 RepID=UPI0023810A45|nr:uncharacterized protein LOC123478198 isoform X2 [Desmodus rotundus]